MNDSRDHSPRLVLIRDRAGVTRPCSIDSLATSLLVSGAAPALAYDIAEHVTTELRATDRSEVTSRDLVELAANQLERHADADAAERYRAWRRLRQDGRPIVLCLMGAPGVGKSSAAARLSLDLGVHRVIPTVALREVLRSVVPDEVSPELHLAAHDAIGPTASDGFTRQARAVTGAAVAVADQSILEGRSLLLVGAHLLPGEVRGALTARGRDAIVVEMLLTMEDERLHRALMLRRTRSDPANPGLQHLRHFEGVRRVQRQLQDLARAAGVVWHELANPSGLTERVVDHVLATADVPPGDETMRAETIA